MFHKRYEDHDYRSYCSADKKQRYDGKIAKNFAERAKSLQTQIRSHMFETFDPMSFINFLSTSTVSSEANGINEGPANWFFHFSIKGLSVPVIKADLWFNKI